MLIHEVGQISMRFDVKPQRGLTYQTLIGPHP